MIAADRLTIEGGTPGAVLMEAAGKGIADIILARFPRRPVAVICGPGNNGGDGFVIARYLAAAGWPVRLALLGQESKLQGDAALNARRWRAEMSGAVEPLTTAVLDGAEIIVDALFGAGLARPLDGAARDVVEKAAAMKVAVIAVDMPSGVDGDSGEVAGAAAPAKLTITFFRKKPGHLLMPGKALSGEVRVIDIGISATVLREIRPSAFENGPGIWGDDFPWPGPDAHKYSRGHVVIGGGAEMTGAARLAARAALRIGAGLVTIASQPEAVPIYASYMPGVLTCPLRRASDFAAYLKDPRRRAVLLGPGQGVDRKTHTQVLTALALGKRVCLDADALTVFGQHAQELFAAIADNAGAGGSVVLTPHEGEFRRLFPHLCQTGGSGLDKLSRARAAARESGATVLIKGSDTVIAAPDGRALINANAPPDLATGGSGDVLAGLIVGLMAQGLGPLTSAGMAAWVHGAAATGFGPGLIAEDLSDCIPGVLRDLRNWYG
ncbi:MAG: NAD(P)H-hydrate dehydratase [Alphaproteobacteria bacterium]|nr:NAD(P)H-hydrate dehydratase [Alphaproteobacteria bacterium]